MSDLISRQAAIGEVKKHYRAYDNDLLELITFDIERLPPAQPELKWIPCDETVDIPDHEVMACDRYGEFIIGYLDYKDEQWLCESDDSLMYDPVAWCELPEPYKEGGADG